MCSCHPSDQGPARVELRGVPKAPEQAARDALPEADLVLYADDTSES